jgi:hypothetical protein
MQLCLGKITKQSQTTDCSIFPRCYGVGCGDGTGRQHPWCQNCTNGFVKRGALSCPRMARASLLRASEPNLAFFRPRLVPMAYRSRRSDPSTGLTNMQGDKAAWSGAVSLHMCTYKPLCVVAGGYQTDCYKLLSTYILTSILDKGEPAAR